MKSTVVKVFLIIAALVMCILVWAIFFNNGGVLQSAYNALAGQVNTVWGNVAGDGSTIMPTWEDNGNKDASDADDNGNVSDSNGMTD